MTALHPDLEALMPKPTSWQIALVQDNEYGLNIVGWRDEFSRASFSYSMLPKREMFTATQMREAILAATERAAKTVPTNWVDSILTGPNRVPGIDKVDCRTIEALLCRIAAAIRGDGGDQ